MVVYEAESWPGRDGAWGCRAERQALSKLSVCSFDSPPRARLAWLVG